MFFLHNVSSEKWQTENFSSLSTSIFDSICSELLYILFNARLHIFIVFVKSCGCFSSILMSALPVGISFAFLAKFHSTNFRCFCFKLIFYLIFLFHSLRILNLFAPFICNTTLNLNIIEFYLFCMLQIGTNIFVHFFKRESIAQRLHVFNVERDQIIIKTH